MSEQAIAHIMNHNSIRILRRSIARTRLRKALLWYRHNDVQESDVFMASYPRSGSTWLRFMLYEVFCGDESEFSTVNQAIPDIGKYDGRKLLPNKRRLLKTHEPYARIYRQGIYLVRDVRDVVVSEYFFQKRIGLRVGHPSHFVSRFLAGKVNAYGSWMSHAKSWLDSDLKNNAGLLVVRYEDMKQNVDDVLLKIVQFLGGELSRERAHAVGGRHTLNRMRAKENRATERITVGESSTIPFIRKGQSGNWREILSEDDIEQINRSCGAVMQRLEYSLG